MKLKKTLIKKAASYARDHFDRKKSCDLPFHDFKHTKRVARYADWIAAKVSINNNDYIILMVAAWLHDLGHVQESTDHETFTAEKFLSLHHLDSVTIVAVMNAILSTRVPQKPTSIVADILCDANLYYFGSKRFFKWTNALRKETQYRTGKKIGKTQWLSTTAELVEAHVYFTDYARKALRKGVKRNLKKLKTRQKRSGGSELSCATHLPENEMQP